MARRRNPVFYRTPRQAVERAEGRLNPLRQYPYTPAGMARAVKDAERLRRRGFNVRIFSFKGRRRRRR